MVENSKPKGFLGYLRAHAPGLGSSKKNTADNGLPLHSPSPQDGSIQQQSSHSSAEGGGGGGSGGTTNSIRDEKRSDNSPSAALSNENAEVAESTAIETKPKGSIPQRIYKNFKEILFSSPMNILLVFVPVGIAVDAAGMSPIIVFSMNAIAIIPLAGLLAHATESVASSLGDTIGALLNVTFGNAVELIIFIIALTKGEINIVQASLVGSILSNLLLILGMCFLFGGLRYREQIYNSTVTQMSACLLSLSVTSLLLPTAFHYAFADNTSEEANNRVLQVSRGTSIILLVIYILYLLFQLKSHAYMYESTPQHIIDEESHPGILTNFLDSSSSSDTSSSSSDSDTTSGSRTTAKRIKRALRRRTRRKSSSSSKETATPSMLRTPSNNGTFGDVVASPLETASSLHAIASGDEADDDVPPADGAVRRRDFGDDLASPALERKNSKKKKRNSKRSKTEPRISEAGEEMAEIQKTRSQPYASSPRVAFTQNTVGTADEGLAARRQFLMRPLTNVRPTMPKMLSQTVFSSANPTGAVVTPTVRTVPKAPYGLRRTSSLPDRLNRQNTPQLATLERQDTESIFPHVDEVHSKHELSKVAAVILLIISTALVATCAEFLVSSIQYMVDNTPIGEVFIGLILLPIIGNAAEHFTAVTVATKNKMDLAIGVAVGSSIQIALFVTPIVVLLGWILNQPMSLYFSLFETMTLFVSAFIVNFLVLDGRSNYLEGALLMAAYIIIAVAAYFYPRGSAARQDGTFGS